MYKFKAGLLIMFFAVNFSISGYAAGNPFRPQLPQPKPPEEIAPPEPVFLPESNSRTETDMYNIVPPLYPDPLTGSRPLADIILEDPKTPEILVIPPIFNIQGVIWQTNRPQAIINDQVVDVGDDFMESRIVSIEKTLIQIEYQGTLFNLTP
jgi:hypothetical protein